MNKGLVKALLNELLEKDGDGGGHDNVPFSIGSSYFLRTVTYHLVGRVRSIVGDFLVLDEVAWVADSGRFMQAINEGKLNEVEPVNGLVRVNIKAVVDAFEWNHKLPREQK